MLHAQRCSGRMMLSKMSAASSSTSLQGVIHTIRYRRSVIQYFIYYTCIAERPHEDVRVRTVFWSVSTASKKNIPDGFVVVSGVRKKPLKVETDETLRFYKQTRTCTSRRPGTCCNIYREYLKFPVSWCACHS